MDTELDKFISGVLAGKAALNSNQEPTIKKPEVSQFSITAPLLKIEQQSKRGAVAPAHGYGLVLVVFYNGVLRDIAVDGYVL